MISLFLNVITNAPGYRFDARAIALLIELHAGLIFFTKCCDEVSMCIDSHIRSSGSTNTLEEVICQPLSNFSRGKCCSNNQD